MQPRQSGRSQRNRLAMNGLSPGLEQRNSGYPPPFPPHFSTSLIPKDIPGSFCVFSFSCLTRSAVGEGLYGPPVPGPTTGAPPEPTREHHKRYSPTHPIRDRHALRETIDSRTHSGFVPNGWVRSRSQNQPRVAHTSRFLRCVRASATGSVDRTKSETVDSRAHSRFVLRIFVFRVSPITSTKHSPRSHSRPGHRPRLRAGLAQTFLLQVCGA